jgi:ubiquinone/menaquinone biosynthesis C-methylase UbiE
MKSLYQYKKFASYWNKRAGNTGEIYKRLVLDPIMFDAVGSLNEKVVFELGCGNGYLALKFIKQNPKSLILADISEYNLEFAKEKCADPRVSFLEQDATEKWRVDSDSVDIVYSNMMLNEVENIKTPIEETFRVLKNGGIFIFSVTHPSWDLFVFAQEKAGKKSNKIQGIGNYFRRGFAKFIMGIDSKTNPALSEEFGEQFKVEHYQRPLSDYFNQLVEANFFVRKIFEPELTEQLLEENPRFVEYKDYPIGLIFCAVKQK